MNIGTKAWEDRKSMTCGDTGEVRQKNNIGTRSRKDGTREINSPTGLVVIVLCLLKLYK